MSGQAIPVRVSGIPHANGYWRDSEQGPEPGEVRYAGASDGFSTAAPAGLTEPSAPTDQEAFRLERPPFQGAFPRDALAENDERLTAVLSLTDDYMKIARKFAPRHLAFITALTTRGAAEVELASVGLTDVPSTHQRLIGILTAGHAEELHGDSPRADHIFQAILARAKMEALEAGRERVTVRDAVESLVGHLRQRAKRGEADTPALAAFRGATSALVPEEDRLASIECTLAEIREHQKLQAKPRTLTGAVAATGAAVIVGAIVLAMALLRISPSATIAARQLFN